MRPGAMISDAFPGKTPVPFLRQAYSPVSKAYRDGVHVAEAEWPSVNFNPSFASRSMFGVLNPRRPVAADVAVAEVVGVNQDDVWPLGGMARRAHPE